MDKDISDQCANMYSNYIITKQKIFKTTKKQKKTSPIIKHNKKQYFIRRNGFMFS